MATPTKLALLVLMALSPVRSTALQAQAIQRIKFMEPPCPLNTGQLPRLTRSRLGHTCMTLSVTVMHPTFIQIGGYVKHDAVHLLALSIVIMDLGRRGQIQQLQVVIACHQFLQHHQKSQLSRPEPLNQK